ncbi:Terminase-like family protein [Scytonema sp. UIC 10036]|uniref:phage terminase large subunit family protein n=1 Tax=Scytonema sp. UIC 10036 TaxID=2304196 RepID=UPI0012DA5DF8|nr:terminase family protein [Scytonema sp. UIC 10036]MUH01037.1 Terminase-like family protein [Scytonema sp. UIC 10036]
MNWKNYAKRGAIALQSSNPLLQNLRQAKCELESGSLLKPLPRDWENFTSLTTIRSGGAMVKFELYDYQKLLINLAQKYPNIVVLKSRQLGVTQAIGSKFLHDACINPAASSILFMRNSEDASAISRRVRQMLNSIPDYAVAENDNVGYLKIKNCGDIYFKNSSREGSRSLDSATGFLFDESAFVDNIEQIYAASSPSSALSKNVQKFIVSTPSAKSGWYWSKLNENNDEDVEELAKRVAEGKLYKDIPGVFWFVDRANCCKLILHWTAHPIYSKIPNYLEYRLEQDGTDEETVSREYDLRFVDSAVAVFNSELVRRNAIGNWEKEPDENAEYYCGLDCSTTGNDYTVFIILKHKNNRYSVVNIYRRKQQTSDFNIYQINELIGKYKPKKVGIEVTGGVGQLYLEQLCRMSKDISFEAIKTNQDTKNSMIGSVVLALEREILEYPHNSELINEMLNFRRQGAKLEAASGKHDDCIMSLAFALSATPFYNQKKGTFLDVDPYWRK